MTSQELIVLVDDTGNPVGIAPKLESHHASTPLHKGFSCYIFSSDGKFLATRRALSKKVWPGVWTNSVCGHPGPDESDELAIQRRTRQELGMTIRKLSVILPDYRYKTPPFNGIIEKEICPVYIALAESDPMPNPEEVEDFAWIDWENYSLDILKKPAKYSYWAKDQMNHIKNNPKILKLTKNS